MSPSRPADDGDAPLGPFDPEAFDAAVARFGHPGGPADRSGPGTVDEAGDGDRREDLDDGSDGDRSWDGRLVARDEDDPEASGFEGLDAEATAEIQAALDGWEAPAHLRDRPLPSRLTAWSRSSFIGAMATGMAFGLREVLDPPRDEPIVIEVDADGEPHDLPVRLLLDPDDPAGSLCIVRRDPPPPLV